MRRSLLRLTTLPVLAALGLVLLAACASEQEFATELPDDAYPLEDMLLDLDDLPLRMDDQNTSTFDNGDWAQLFDVDDLRGKVNQLKARGRINAAVREFSWTSAFPLAGPWFITVQSTLYTDVDAARDSLSLFCGTVTDERTATDVSEFWVADIGDGVQGLILGEQVEGPGRIVETIVCFRTGRVVHAVLLQGLDGSEDIALSVRIARRMYEHVSAVFEDIEPPSPT